MSALLHLIQKGNFVLVHVFLWLKEWYNNFLPIFTQNSIMIILIIEILIKGKPCQYYKNFYQLRPCLELKVKKHLKKSELVHVQYKNLKCPSILTVENLISMNK